MSRDIRTLLFCKTMPNDLPENPADKDKDKLYSHVDIYKKISQPAGRQTFFAFGGYNAMCIYPTLVNPDDPEWLAKIYMDKQSMLMESSGNTICHQMHLISRHDEVKEFWNISDCEYPYFFATLVYGVKREKNGSYIESECSFYEHRMREYLASKIKKGSTEICYAVYNGINISDVVILWRAKRINLAMKLIACIEYEGIARNTLTTIGFSMNSDGQIKPCVLEALKKYPEDKLQVTVRGSIRDIISFREFEKDLFESKPNIPCAMPDGVTTMSSGKYDFTVTANVTHINLVQLLEVYYDKTDIISAACWELYTDLLVSDKAPDCPNKATIPSDILSKVYDDYQRIYLERALYKYSWGNSLLEQVSTHYYMDRHPILHGPSYLIYNTLSIANSYFCGKVAGYSDEKNIKRLLEESEESITYFVQNLDQLTDQITRNDDAVLNNRSNTHTIHFSIPESALDFYHAFLRRIVEYLTVYDERENRKPDGFEYDFLFTPKSILRFRFTTMFETHHDSQPQAEDRQIWPSKQAYLLEFPMESVFKPMSLFIPMVHECFHCFGDVLRRREQRKEHMIYFVSTTIATSLECGGKDYYQLVRKLANEIRNNMHIKGKCYLDRTANQLRNSTYQVFDMDILDKLFEELGGTAYYLYSTEILSKWSRLKSCFYNSKRDQLNTGIFDSIIEACKYYFKECYADAMTIALLKLTPSEYLNLAKDELDQLYTKQKYGSNPNNIESVDSTIAWLAQRFGIVLAACQLSGTFEKSEDVYEGAVRDFNGTYASFKGMLYEVYTALISRTSTLPIGINCFPPAALKQVVDYLLPSMKALQDCAPELSLSDNVAAQKKSYDLNDLRNDFNNIIRGSNMFSQRFYQLIYEDHEEVRKAANPKA